uniref:Uncharacterized protein n=1 Tax=Athene cunicularia TaxID=194338 RepID=A0A663LPL0_ATHCN
GLLHARPTAWPSSLPRDAGGKAGKAGQDRTGRGQALTTRWIWTRECQKEIEREKKEYYKKHSTLQKDLEAKYRDVITENRRTVAHLELELEKERNRTLSYRQALVSQSRKLVEERRILEQEQEKLEREKQILLHSGAAGNLYQSCLAKEEEWQKRASILLKEFEAGLQERQDIYCSLVVPRSQRLEIEKNLLVKAATDPVAMALQMESGLKDIFKHDNYCGNLLNRNKSQNGRLMWLRGGESRAVCVLACGMLP